MKTNKKSYMVTVYFESNNHFTYSILAFDQFGALSQLAKNLEAENVPEEKITHIHFEAVMKI